MKAERLWSHFFKPEVRSSGLKELKKDAIAISLASDTQIQAYARGTSSQRITLSSASIASPVFTAKCSCPAGKKGNFCKHIWATLLAAEIRHPDFFDAKTQLELADAEEEAPSPAKLKQEAYRKEQYERQKQRAKDLRAQKKASLSPKTKPSLPADVEEALEFFSQNGFPLDVPVDEEALKQAKKKLAKVFHPDLGGSHEETVLLNRNFDVLSAFLNS